MTEALPDLPRVYSRCTEWTVSCLPEDDINASVYSITVAYRGAGRWAVVWHGMCLGVDGTWDYEVRPFEREDEWLAAHRFDFNTALDLAQAAAPLITVNGHTVAEALARHQEPTP